MFWESNRRHLPFCTHNASLRSEWVWARGVSACADDRQPVLAPHCQCRGMQWHDIVCYHMNVNQPQRKVPQINKTTFSILGMGFRGMSKKGSPGQVEMLSAAGCSFVIGMIKFCEASLCTQHDIISLNLFSYSALWMI